ncbi:baculo_p74_N domain-containing protein [Trichonephila inaurata madagascariensis]|uniref:Baculo_p74_N domain-containing protein n=1 Tax=Trichonephila inaurata madagascariensis TaxID=2747483 RepID=A0A8X6MEW5_9ARAC|nr:baculo_p74_N domain-containing protein [Trichonephila inaurata madagascariensis]
MTHLYVPQELLNDAFLQHAAQEKLITLETVEPEDCAHIEHHPVCACDSSCQLVVHGKSIIVTLDQHVVSAYPCYALPKDCTSEEMVTIVTWLTRHQFWTFGTALENGSLVRSHLRKCIVMPRPSKYELQHALRYATEHTTRYLLDRYRQRYPHYFQHVEIQIRPATLKDYYIPPSLATECIVVDQIHFTELGCKRLSCFPFKSDGVPCTRKDDMQWTRLANTLVLSCQPSCREMTTSIDAEWWGSRCVMVNPLKKVLASFPEQIFGMQSKHPLHAGLDWRNGQIYLNKLYCQAYGLEFDGKECYSSVDQTIGEFFLGKTVYRALKTSVVQPPNYAHIPPVPSHPAVSLEVNLSDTIPLPDTSQVAREVTTELLVDFGVDIAAHVVEKILRKKAPQLLLKAAGNLPIQSTPAKLYWNQTLSLSVKSH